MVYTCYEMIRDCRANRPDGWRYFVRHYVPVMRRLLAHYFPDRSSDAGLIEQVLVDLRRPESNLFQSLDPTPERAFVAELRQRVLEAAQPEGEASEPEIAIGLDDLGEAFAQLTVTEKLVIWLETMRYDAGNTGRMLRMSVETAAKIRQRGAELLRAKMDAWRQTLLADNGPTLGRTAAAALTKDCPPAKAFFDLIDGRTTWWGREQLEQHVRNCWHCLDHFCRLLEVVQVLRGLQPLDETEAKAFDRLMGVSDARRAFWQRMSV